MPNAKAQGRIYANIKTLKRIAPLALVDALILCAAYALTYSIRTNSLIFDSAHILRFIALALIVSVVSLYAWGNYHRLWARTSGHDVTIIAAAALSAFGIIFILNLLLTPRPFPISAIIVSHLLVLSGYVAVRYRTRLITGLEWRWYAIWHHEFPEQQTRVLIVGAGEAGEMTALRLEHRYLNGHSGFTVVGFVDDDPRKHGLYIQGVPVFASCDQIAEVAQQHNIELIVFAIHNLSGVRFRHLLTLCEKTPARIKIVPDVLALLNNNANAPLLRDVQAEDLLGRQPIEWCSNIDATPVRDKVVLVTGAAGSIGSELCLQMLKHNPTHLIMVDNNESGLHDTVTDLKRTHPDATITAVLVDISIRQRIDFVFKKYQPQVIFHAAAYKHVPLLEDFPHEAIRVNVMGTLNVAEAAQSHGAERFVLISTDKAVNPCSVMGASKRICELLTLALSTVAGNRTVFAAVRFGNVLGSRGSVVPTFTRQIESGGPVTITDEKMVRYFMSIPEAVNLVIQAACLTQGEDLYMLRMGEQVPIIELAERMIRLRGLRPRIDIPIKITGIRPGEKLFEELHADFESQHTTIHPDIVRLNGVKCHWTPERFIAQARELDALQIADPEVALEKLTDLAASVISEDVVIPCQEG